MSHKGWNHMNARVNDEIPGSVLQLSPGSNMTDAQREFAVAMDNHLTRVHRKTDPQPEDVLDVAWALGYRKVELNG